MRLAAMMRCTVAEIQDRMSHAEFIQWLAFLSVEPLGEQRADLHAAMLAAMFANANRDPSTRPEAFTVDDFIIDFWEERPAPSLRDKFMQIAARINAQNGLAP